MALQGHIIPELHHPGKGWRGSHSSDVKKSLRPVDQLRSQQDTGGTRSEGNPRRVNTGRVLSGVVLGEGSTGIV